MTHAQVLQMLRDLRTDPDNVTNRRRFIKYLAHKELGEYRQRKQWLDNGFGDRDLCPRCLGTGEDEVGSDVSCLEPGCNGTGTLEP